MLGVMPSSNALDLASPHDEGSPDEGPANGPPLDRRRQRSARGRDGVVEALLQLYNEGDSQPGAAKISARAGVSQRSVFRYFDDLESLAAAAIELQWSRVAPAFAPPASGGSLEHRIRALVSQRLRAHDASAAVGRAAVLLEPRSPAVARAFGFRREVFRRQVESHFASELELAGGGRADLLDALDAVSSFEHLEYLRTVAGHSRTRTATLTIRTLSALLSGNPNGVT